MARRQLQFLIGIFLLLAGISTVALAKTQWTVVPDYSVGNIYSEEGKLYVGTVASLTHCAVECHATKHCVAMGYGNVSKLCYHYKMDITVLPLTSLTVTTSLMTYYRVTCDNGFLYLQDYGRCVMLFSDRLQWQEASDLCGYLGGYLLVVKSRALLDYFFTLSYYDNNHFWLAGHESGGVWTWSSGDVIDSSNGGYLWKPGKPNNGYSCMETEYSSTMGMLVLQNRNCSFERKFYCQTSSD